MNVAIIDYGSGNLHSACKAFERAARDLNGCTISLVKSAAEVARADRIVLPGVGAFADCRSGLDAIPDMVATLRRQVIERARPFLGICVGQQLMAAEGLEKTVTPGFSWISGQTVRIEPAPPLKIPQIGWNTLEPRRSHALLEGIPTGPDGWHAYFVHSYHISVAREEELIATTDYGGPVTAMVGRDNFAGTQFHPEKSQKLGLALIANFLKWKP